MTVVVNKQVTDRKTKSALYIIYDYREHVLEAQ